ncbi:MAG: HD-GYP domain-containing protein, partial [bacterium]
FAASRKFILTALTSSTAVRHSETGGRIFRIQRFVKLLCDALSSHPRFHRFLTPQTIDLLVQLAPIHDVGKVGVPDRILMKPGPLTPEEFQVIQRHVTYGWEVLEDAREKSGVRDEALFELARDIVYTHHERWDGSGYPRRLRGPAIPIPGRLLAVADVYDALVSKRVYKGSVPHSEAVRTTQAGRGTQFDPDIVDAFLAAEESWRLVSAGFSHQGTVAGSSQRHPPESNARAGA